MRFHWFLSVVFFAFTVSPVGAQQTWIIDSANGPGTDFTEIEAGIQAATSGDTLLVKPGGYTGFSDNKGLSILGEAGVFVSSGFEIRNLPAGARSVVRAVRITSVSGGAVEGVILTDNLGPVHLDGVIAFSGGFFGSMIVNCTLVTMSRCELRGGTDTLRIVGSSVQMDTCSLTETPNSGSGCSGTVLTCTQSTVALGATSVAAGGPIFANSLSHGISVGSGQLTLGAGSSVSGGFPVSGGPCAALTVSGAAQVNLDPSVTVSGAIVGTVTTNASASISTSAGEPGGNLEFDILAEPGTRHVSFFNVPAAPLPTLLGDLWVSVPLVVLDSGIVPSSGTASISLPIPPSTQPGLVIGIQAAILDGPLIDFTTPGAVVIGQ